MMGILNSLRASIPWLKVPEADAIRYGTGYRKVPKTKKQRQARAKAVAGRKARAKQRRRK